MNYIFETPKEMLREQALKGEVRRFEYHALQIFFKK